MKQILITLVLFFTSTFALAHGDEDLRVSIEPESTAQYTAGQFDYVFNFMITIRKKF